VVRRMPPSHVAAGFADSLMSAQSLDSRGKEVSNLCLERETRRPTFVPSRGVNADAISLTETPDDRRRSKKRLWPGKT
jgi:hypothetical protein